jgi:hypothetical protein
LAEIHGRYLLPRVGEKRKEEEENEEKEEKDKPQ